MKLQLWKNIFHCYCPMKFKRPLVCFSYCFPFIRIGVVSMDYYDKTVNFKKLRKAFALQKIVIFILQIALLRIVERDTIPLCTCMYHTDSNMCNINYSDRTPPPYRSRKMKTYLSETHRLHHKSFNWNRFWCLNYTCTTKICNEKSFFFVNNSICVCIVCEKLRVKICIKSWIKYAYR